MTGGHSPAVEVDGHLLSSSLWLGIQSVIELVVLVVVLQDRSRSSSFTMERPQGQSVGGLEVRVVGSGELRRSSLSSSSSSWGYR
ncbi:hypothetical protein DFP72DRAFT_1079286 [Ephemerocybe angulata]|uniref:Uncharacterized protein n=1 Tax=Ephemerocybe angulata TaxID=980116 RepID=A0A8H6LU67_9AGAR|nr:hypothetical protein DFP72DRAFT_1079286 [Tulosesus angulatus]